VLALATFWLVVSVDTGGDVVASSPLPPRAAPVSTVEKADDAAYRPALAQAGAEEEVAPSEPPVDPLVKTQRTQGANPKAAALQELRLSPEARTADSLTGPFNRIGRLLSGSKDDEIKALGQRSRDIVKDLRGYYRRPDRSDWSELQPKVVALRDELTAAETGNQEVTELVALVDKWLANPPERAPQPSQQ
jgi:hypothetical protein